jgi:hypothetical protein
MICFIFALFFFAWGMVNLFAWVLSLIFAATMSAVWVAKVAGICLILSFLVDTFTSYKGNSSWY